MHWMLLRLPNAPRDSAMGKLRASQGIRNRLTFGLSRLAVETTVLSMYEGMSCLKEAIHKVYPRVTVIGNVITDIRNRVDWVDSHYYGDEMFLLLTKAVSTDSCMRKDNLPCLLENLVW